jgi:hypothetical protein
MGQLGHTPRGGQVPDGACPAAPALRLYLFRPPTPCLGAPESNAARSWRLAQHDRGNHSVDASERSALSERSSQRAPAPAQQRNGWLVETRRPAGGSCRGWVQIRAAERPMRTAIWLSARRACVGAISYRLEIGSMGDFCSRGGNGVLYEAPPFSI